MKARPPIDVTGEEVIRRTCVVPLEPASSIGSQWLQPGGNLAAAKATLRRELLPLRLSGLGRRPYAGNGKCWWNFAMTTFPLDSGTGG